MGVGGNYGWPQHCLPFQTPGSPMCLSVLPLSSPTGPPSLFLFPFFSHFSTDSDSNTIY